MTSNGRGVLRRALAWAGAALAAAALAGSAGVWWLNVDDPLAPAPQAAAAAAAAVVERGAYLARAGNCKGCHTAPDGADYAGGRGVPTPFGTVYASNLTSDAGTGLGGWNPEQFWRALHNGRSRDGRLLYPAFPYPNFTRVTREDSDALYAFLRTLPAVVQPNRAHELRFPFDRQATLAVWRALYFRPVHETPDASRSAAWNRGAYLVEGLGHCNACHASRNALGASASTLDLAGGLIPVQNWYAPSLTAPTQAGVAEGDPGEIVELLASGVSTRGAVSGPMGEVVAGSTQHLTRTDLLAIVTYLQSLAPASAAPAARAAPPAAPAPDDATGPGATLYDDHCASCHGEHGQGVPAAYPALAANRAVTMEPPANLVHIVQEGGFAPATAGNPRPFGMPPFATELSDTEVAQVLTSIRARWGNHAPAVTALDVRRYGAHR